MLRILWLAAASTGALAAQGMFEIQEIAKELGVVYAVTTGDVNGDGKTDVIALSATQLLWFENPGWTRHVVAEKVTEKDNVCVAPYDVDGDGKLDFALGADWQATNTTGGRSLHWVSFTGKITNLTTEPTIHRIRWADVDGDGRAELIVVPLHGRGTKPPEWSGTVGTRILVFHIPKNPTAETWPVEVADESLHIAHNFITVDREIWVASAEGVTALRRGSDGLWTKRQIAEGKPGEIKLGRVAGKRILATVEPWHANGIVLLEEAAPLWKRTPIESELNQGHALGWGDFDGDGNDELAAGWRGKPWGLALYKLAGGKWNKTVVDDGVSVEDLAVADLNGDGKPEIVAGGRTTQNLRIYWNRFR